MASKDSAEFLVEKFGRRYSVVFGLELENQIANEQLYHVSTYFHYGRVEAGFEPPPEVTPGARVTMVARATARLPAGSSGFLLYRIGHRGPFHLVVTWSAPRNFYVHSNVLAAGITTGEPIQMDESGDAALFNKMYNHDNGSPGSFFSKVVCDYGNGTRQGTYINNRFHLTMSLSDQHLSMNSVVIRNVGEKNIADVSFRGARVKLIAHSRNGAWSRRNNSDLSFQKNHVALIFDFYKADNDSLDDSVILCELSGKPHSKRDVALSDTSVPLCLGTTKSALLKARASLGLRTFGMGEAFINEEDLHYLVTKKVQVDQNLDLDDRCYQWLRNLADLLNLPNQDIILEARDSIVQEEPMRVPPPPEVYDSNGVVEGAGFGQGLFGSEAIGVLTLSKIISNEKLKAAEIPL